MQRKPIIAIIGRPNVGKSTLFNRLLKKRQAIVSPVSGTTRDRLYGDAVIGEIEVELVDTAGLSSDLSEMEFGPEMLEQVQLAVKEADLLLFVLNAQEGFTAEDHQLAEIIRKAEVPAIVFVNKVDDLEHNLDSKLLATGMPTFLGSLTQRRGIKDLMDEMIAKVEPISQQQVHVVEPQYPHITIAGRPNVGKSTLFNALTGEERVIVSDIAGTTRDMIDTKLTLPTGETYIITDTAGLRRRGKVGRAEKIEQYSVLRTFKAIDMADLVLLVVDSLEGLTRGDAHVAMRATEQKKRLITVFNKADLVNTEEVNYRRFPFLSRNPMIFVSAKDGLFIDRLLDLIRESLHTWDQEQSQSFELETPPTTLDQ